MQVNMTSGESDRIRKNSPFQQNREIDRITKKNIEEYSNTPDEVIAHHLRKLDKEWDIERSLELNMSTLALTGIFLSLFSSRRWLILPVAVLGFFIQHAIQGWCPPLSVFRSMKIRSRSEIEQEKYGLKALRGDFIGIDNSEEAMKAVQRY